MSRRAEAWAAVGRETLDLLVVGGGASGAAVLREAARAGVRGLLVEARDFASGTSSRSSKIAHGGLRYLETLQFGLVLESVRERDRWVREGGGLAVPLPFLAASRREERWRHARTLFGVWLYNLFGGRLPRRRLEGRALQQGIPALAPDASLVGAPYDEAAVDDARWVLRLLQEAEARGARALNYVAAAALLREGGRVVGAVVRDALTGEQRQVRARVTLNTTGVEAASLEGVGHLGVTLRPQRGSHLLFPRARLPLDRGISFRHPRDRRWVCAMPWEDMVVMGTTDLVHALPLSQPPSVTRAEFEYLLEAARTAFPSAALAEQDVVSCWAGLRAILDAGGASAVDASREHLVRAEPGLVTLTGGKLTGSRPQAHDALRAAEVELPALASVRKPGRFLDAPAELSLPGTSAAAVARLRARYGARAAEVAAAARVGELEFLPGVSTLGVELRWAAREEQVVHLEDLLLRRTRLGLFLPEGGKALLPLLQGVLEEELGWDAARWAEELARYQQAWKAQHAVPPAESPRGALQ